MNPVDPISIALPCPVRISAESGHSNDAGRVSVVSLSRPERHLLDCNFCICFSYLFRIWMNDFDSWVDDLFRTLVYSSCRSEDALHTT